MYTGGLDITIPSARIYVVLIRYYCFISVGQISHFNISNGIVSGSVS